MGYRPILIVDRDRLFRATVSELLRCEGFTVTEASDGAVALGHVLAASPLPGLILLDPDVPVMSGRELVRIVGGYIRLSKVPIVLMTDTPVPPWPSVGAVVAQVSKRAATQDLLAMVRTHALSVP